MITEEERIHVKNTLALLNSMIKCGDQHSARSNKMLDRAFKILKPAPELYLKMFVYEINPEEDGWYPTDKGNLYWGEGEWSCREEYVSAEYPDVWYKVVK